MTRNDSSEEAIIQKILDDAEAQAKRILDGANRTADSHRKKAETQAESIRQEILDQARAKAEALRAKEVATARLESKRILLGAREEVVNRAFKRIEQELANLRNSQDYRRILLALAREAIGAIAESKVALRVSKTDEKLIDEAFMAELRHMLGQESGRDKVEIDIKLDPQLDDGGCIATSEDGRVVFDNTFTRRFRRIRSEIRSMLIGEIVSQDE